MSRLLKAFASAFALALLFAGAPSAYSEARLVRVHNGTGDHTYALDNEIGRGYWSAAYLAHDAQTNATAVIKVLHPERLAEGKQDSFAKENELMTSMDQRHAAFSRTLGVGETNDATPTRALVMEAVKGEPVWNGGPKPVGRSVRIIERVLDSLSQLHQSGWIHNDIHGGNVLWDPAQGSPSTKVLDLGNAQRITPQRGPVVDVQAAGRLLVKLASGLDADKPGANAPLDRDIKVTTNWVRGPRGAFQTRSQLSLGQIARNAIAGRYQTADQFKAALKPFERD